jgi:hypothetical protein
MSEAELRSMLMRNSSLKIKEINEIVEEKMASGESLGEAKGVPAETKMNKLEQRYAAHLEAEKHLGRIVWWMYHPCNLRLADPKCFYEIDFMYIDTEYRVHYVETKGGRVWDDALVKFKVAATTFPHFIFHWVTQEKGEWKIKTIQGGRWI